jgi:hypothetical protein
MKGQKEALLHEVLVQLVTTPEVLGLELLGGTFILSAGGYEVYVLVQAARGK